MRIGVGARVILTIIAAAGIVTVAGLLPGVAILLPNERKNKTYSTKQYVKRSIDSLIKSGLLKYTKSENGEKALTLTRKGKWEAGIRGIAEKTQASETAAKWDGKWRIVIFDVPVSKNYIRDELRRPVELRGFYQLQKSVWVFPYPCDDFISLLRKYLKLKGEVLYMKVSYIENDKHLRSYFKLYST